MDFKSKIIKTKLIHELEDPEYYPDKSSDSLLQTTINDRKITSCTLSPKKSCRRSIQKRVITVPINDGDGARLKGEMGTPPSDSWSWRKYGQKPIKGSPFPRGYYRCSSSKGCPARKQVEKSREDPNTLVVAYYCDHNHPFPPPRKSNNQNQLSSNLYDHEKVDEEQEEEDFKKLTNNNIDSKFSNNIENELSKHKVTRDTNGVRGNDYESWFCDYDDATYSTLLEVPFFNFEEDKVNYGDHMSMMYTMRHEDDEAIFADLGELPECSAVFCRKKTEIEEERRGKALHPVTGPLNN